MEHRAGEIAFKRKVGIGVDQDTDPARQLNDPHLPGCGKGCLADKDKMVVVLGQAVAVNGAQIDAVHKTRATGDKLKPKGVVDLPGCGAAVGDGGKGKDIRAFAPRSKDRPRRRRTDGHRPPPVEQILVFIANQRVSAGIAHQGVAPKTAKQHIGPKPA